MTRPPPPWTYIVGVVVFVVSGLLLFSFGGAAIAASPVTLPLMLLTVWRHPTLGFRISGALIAGLTVAEVAWALVYGMTGEASVAVWMIPAACALATAFAFTLFGRSQQARSPNGVRGPARPTRQT